MNGKKIAAAGALAVGAVAMSAGAASAIGYHGDPLVDVGNDCVKNCETVDVDRVTGIGTHEVVKSLNETADVLTDNERTVSRTLLGGMPL